MMNDYFLNHYKEEDLIASRTNLIATACRELLDYT